MKKIMDPHVIGCEEIAGGKWLVLHRLQVVNKFGHRKDWECVSRVNTTGAVMMIATLRPSGRLVLVRQFRPPVGKLTLEFPAGLIDAGEDPVDTAVRELYEETGYRGTVDMVYPASCTSPGMSGEGIVIVTMSVDETVHPERPGTPEMEDDEDIETLLVAPGGLAAFIDDERLKGHAIDSKIQAYALALQMLPHV